MWVCYSVQEPVLLAGGKRSNNVFVGCWHAFPEVHQLREVMSLPSQIAPVFFQLCCKAGLAAEGMGNSTFHKLAGIRRKAIGKFPFGIWLSGLSVPASQAVIVHKKSSLC